MFFAKQGETNKMTSTQSQLPSLALCIVLDIVGCASFTLPFIGEFSDVIWAPLSGIIFYNMFGGKMGVFGGGLSFLEELLPFTDFIPTFSIAWYMRSRAIGKGKGQLMIVKQ